MDGSHSEEAISILWRILGSPELINCLVNQEASGNRGNSVNTEISALFRPNQCLNVTMGRDTPQPSTSQQVQTLFILI